MAYIVETMYVDINKDVPQGTVLGPFLYLLMVKDIIAVDAKNNLLVKFADDITASAPCSLKKIRIGFCIR